MAKKQPNPLQKMVRGFLRDMINQTNDQKPDKSSKPKRKKLVVENLELDPKSNANKYFDPVLIDPRENSERYQTLSVYFVLLPG
jgi:hypothetical protein